MIKTLIIAGICFLALIGLIATGVIRAIMHDGRKLQDEYDRAWRQKRLELERGEGEGQ